MTIHFNDLTFKFKKDFEAYVRTKIYEIGFGTYDRSNEHFGFFFELSKLHPFRDLHVAIIAFVLVPNPLMPKYIHMEIRYESNEQIAFSWNKCLGKKFDVFGMALRSAIHNQILDYRNAQKMLVCALCNTKNANFQVDHILPFSQIRDEWLTNNPAANVFIKNKTTMIDEIADQVYVDNWRTGSRLSP